MHPHLAHPPRLVEFRTEQLPKDDNVEHHPCIEQEDEEEDRELLAPRQPHVGALHAPQPLEGQGGHGNASRPHEEQPKPP